MAVESQAQDTSRPPVEASQSIFDAVPERTPAVEATEGGVSTSPLSLLQSNFPTELILPPPTQQAVQNAKRFVPQTIDPELPLRLVVGRPKVLQLSQTPKRIYTPSDKIIRTEIIDDQSGKEVAVTGLEAGTTTLIFWFDNRDAPGGQSTVAYEVRVYADPLFARPTKDLQTDLNEKFPNSYIELDELSDRLIVRGQVPDVIEMSQILRHSGRFARGVRPDITPTRNAANFKRPTGPINARSFTISKTRLKNGFSTRALAAPASSIK